MSVSSISNTHHHGEQLQAWRTTMREARQDFAQIYKAMQSGDLAAAQAAYSGLQALRTDATVGGATQNTIMTDWVNLGTALQSGDLTAARSAFSTLTLDAQPVADGALQAQASTSGATAVQAAAGTVGNDLNALAAALQASNTTSAHSVLAQLIQDLRTSGTAQSGQAGSEHHHHFHGGGHSGQFLASLLGMPVAAPGTSGAASSDTQGGTSSAA